jgi:hypothetical protein
VLWSVDETLIGNFIREIFRISFFRESQITQMESSKGKLKEGKGLEGEREVEVEVVEGEEERGRKKRGEAVKHVDIQVRNELHAPTLQNIFAELLVRTQGSENICHFLKYLSIFSKILRISAPPLSKRKVAPGLFKVIERGDKGGNPSLLLSLSFPSSDKISKSQEVSPPN